MRASLVQELCVKVCCQPVSTVFMQSKDFNFNFLQLLYNANKARPSKQCEFSNYLLGISLIIQDCQSGVGSPGGPGGVGSPGVPSDPGGIGEPGCPGGNMVQVINVVKVVRVVSKDGQGSQGGPGGPGGQP